MIQITLECCTCGAKKNVCVTQNPTFGFEVFDIAQNAGWCPVIDLNYGRTLCFCDEECMKKQLTKKRIHSETVNPCPKDAGDIINKSFISWREEHEVDGGIKWLNILIEKMQSERLKNNALMERCGVMKI